MLSSSPVILHQQTLDEKDQALVTQFVTWANDTLPSKPVSLYMNRHCDFIYQEEKQKPIIGFASIYHHIRELKHEIPAELAENLFALEVRQKKHPMRKLKLWRILNEYKNPHPDMSCVIQALAAEKGVTPIQVNTYPFVDPCEYTKFMDEGPECLDVYLDAWQLPELRQLIACAWQLEKMRIETTGFFAGITAAKDHQQLMSHFQLEFKKYAYAAQVLQNIVFQFEKLVEDDVPFDQLDELIKLIMTVGKKYSKNIRSLTSNWQYTGVTLEKMFSDIDICDPDDSIKARMAVAKLREILDNRSEDALVFSSEDAVAMPDIEDITRKHLSLSEINTGHIGLLDELLSRIKIREGKSFVIEKQQIARLLQMIDGVSLGEHLSLDRWSSWENMTPLQRAIKSGDVELVKMIWHRIQQASIPPAKPKPDLIPYVMKADLSDNVRKDMIKLFFSAGADVPDMTSMTEAQVTMIKQAYVDCMPGAVADEMEVLDSHLKPDPTNLVEYYCREVSEVVQPARQLVGQRMFARVGQKDVEAALQLDVARAAP